jgi:hypothetical protein
MTTANERAWLASLYNYIFILAKFISNTFESFNHHRSLLKLFVYR